MASCATLLLALLFLLRGAAVSVQPDVRDQVPHTLGIGPSDFPGDWHCFPMYSRALIPGQTVRGAPGKCFPGSETFPEKHRLRSYALCVLN